MERRFKVKRKYHPESSYTRDGLFQQIRNTTPEILPIQTDSEYSAQERDPRKVKINSKVEVYLYEK